MPYTKTIFFVFFFSVLFVCICRSKRFLTVISCVIDVDATYIIIINTHTQRERDGRRCLLKQFISQMNDFTETQSFIRAKVQFHASHNLCYVFLTSHINRDETVVVATMVRQRQQRQQLSACLYFYSP